MLHRSISPVALLVAILLAGPNAFAEPIVYFSNLDSIESAPASGGAAMTVVPGLENVRRLAIASGKLYWVRTFPSAILRSDLDGSNVETVKNTGVTAFGMAVDAQNAKVYWALQSTIHRANLDGSGEELLANVNINPGDLELDVAAGKMYWTLVSTGLIQRADLDGSNVETIVSGLGNPNGLTLDVTGGKLYWTDLFAAVDAVWSADLDGTNAVVILNDANAVNADAIEFDPVSGRLYFQSTSGVVRSMNPDGSDVQAVGQSTNTTINFRGVAVHESASPPPVPSLRGPALPLLVVGSIVASAVFGRRRFAERQAR